MMKLTPEQHAEFRLAHLTAELWRERAARTQLEATNAAIQSRAAGDALAALCQRLGVRVDQGVARINPETGYYEPAVTEAPPDAT